MGWETVVFRGEEEEGREKRLTGWEVVREASRAFWRWKSTVSGPGWETSLFGIEVSDSGAIARNAVSQVFPRDS